MRPSPVGSRPRSLPCNPLRSPPHSLLRVCDRPPRRRCSPLAAIPVASPLCSRSCIPAATRRASPARSQWLLVRRSSPNRGQHRSHLGGQCGDPASSRGLVPRRILRSSHRTGLRGSQSQDPPDSRVGSLRSSLCSAVPASSPSGGLLQLPAASRCGIRLDGPVHSLCRDRADSPPSSPMHGDLLSSPARSRHCSRCRSRLCGPLSGRLGSRP